MYCPLFKPKLLEEIISDKTEAINKIRLSNYETSEQITKLNLS